MSHNGTKVTCQISLYSVGLPGREVYVITIGIYGLGGGVTERGGCGVPASRKAAWRGPGPRPLGVGMVGRAAGPRNGGGHPAGPCSALRCVGSVIESAILPYPLSRRGQKFIGFNGSGIC